MRVVNICCWFMLTCDTCVNGLSVTAIYAMFTCDDMQIGLYNCANNIYSLSLAFSPTSPPVT